jgi:hypothetical protein
MERILYDHDRGSLSRPLFQFLHSVPDDSQQFECHTIDDGTSQFFSDDFGSIPGRFAGKKKKSNLLNKIGAAGK